jgi:hypothetical protein
MNKIGEPMTSMPTQQQIEVGDQLIVSREGRLQLRKPTGPHSYTVKAECGGYRGGIWEIAEFLSKLSGLSVETYCLPGWVTATVAVFLDPGKEKATEDQKRVAA